MGAVSHLPQQRGTATTPTILGAGIDLPMSIWPKLALGILGWEGFWWARRRMLRGSTYEEARAKARQLNRPLLVVGAPDGGVTAGYGCGDATLDLVRSYTCPNPIVADITKHIPFEDDSVVAFVSCVLEYVDNYEAALRELRRVAGKHLYVVRIEPWTLTAYLYPGTKRAIVSLP